MSDLMLLAVLRMPPELWTGEAIDVIQRHARYIDAADRIEAQQSKIATLTEQVRAQDKWISVDVRLPELHQKVLIRIPVCEYFNIENGEYKGGGEFSGAWCDRRGKGHCYSVTHWMPLPTPPKEAE